MQYKVFGCKVNKYYTDKWLNSPYMKDKKGIFIASCVVTDQAKRKWLKFIRETVADIKNNEKIYISGCGAFKDGKAQDDFFELYPELLKNKNIIEVLGEDPDEKKIDFKLKQIPQLYTKKFVLIQGGCDSFCTFCLTVIKRGRHYSRSKEDIRDEINEFEENGGKEVVLTGVNLSAWGLDSTNDIGKTRFAELIEYLLDNTNIPRLRISSLGPEFIDDKCIKLFANTRIYPHFHFSIQSGSNSVLKNMSRHYDGDYIRKILKKVRDIKREDNIDISIGADIIVGFPGETDKDFLDTIDLIKNYKITKLHAFPFSDHKMGESVPAGLFKNQVDGKVKKDRMFQIMSISDKIRDDFIDDNIGKELKVLIEIVKDGKWKGWTQNYIEADSNNFEIMEGKIKRNEIVTGKLIK